MGTADGMLRAARASLGMNGRPNAITRDYASRHGSEFLKAPWCDMAVTRWARISGNKEAVLPRGDRAYTVWHAEDFQKIGRWHAGTAANVDKAKPGDIVFFDWGASNDINKIDHVGVVEKVLGGGRLQTIEGNTDNAVKRRVRSASSIAGLGRPAYDREDDDVSAEDVWNHKIKTGDDQEMRAGTVLGHMEKTQDGDSARLTRVEDKLDRLIAMLGESKAAQ